jgi:hypothetical protein
MHGEPSESLDISKLSESELVDSLTVELVDGRGVDEIASNFFQDKKTVIFIVYINFKIILGTGKHMSLGMQVGDQNGECLTTGIIKYREGKDPEILFPMPPASDATELKLESAIYTKLRGYFSRPKN